MGTDAGINLTSTDARNVNIITSNANYNDKDTWTVRDMTSDWNDTDEYWTMSVGGQAQYMPTFNKNKDSLEADINGTYDPNGDGNLADRYNDYKDWTLSEYATLIGDEIYDADTNTIDEYKEGTGVLGTNYTLTESVEHSVSTTLNTVTPEGYSSPIISYWDWDSLSDEEKVGAYWVQIGDWVYWAQPIESGTTTGLLIDEIKPKGSFSDSWYYAIDVVGQFITADDHGLYDETGFYVEDDYEDTVNFLSIIGVDVPTNTSGNTLKTATSDQLTWNAGNSLIVTNESEDSVDIKNIKLLNTETHYDTTLDEETLIFTISLYEETKYFYFEVELADGTTFTQMLKMEHPFVWADEYEMDADTGLIAVDENGEKIEASWDIETGKSIILELPDKIGDSEYEWNKDVTWYVIDESGVSEYYTVEEHPSIEGAWILTHLEHENCDHTSDSFRIYYYWNENPNVKGDRGFNLIYPGYEEDYGDDWE